MNILAFSLDAAVSEPESAVSQRFVLYGTTVDSITVLFPMKREQAVKENTIFHLSSTVMAYGIQKRNKIVTSIRFYRLVNTLMKEKKCDLIIVQDHYFLGLIAAVLARKHHVALEVQVHGFEKLNFLRRKLARYVLKRADGVRVVSLRLKRELMTYFTIQEERISVVPVLTSYQSGQLAPSVSAKTGVNTLVEKKSSYIFLMVSRLVKIKDIPLALQAFAEINKEYAKLKPLLWIVGEGPERTVLESIVQKLGLSNVVTFLGKKNQQELFDLYQQARAFLLTSKSEGWGMTVVEAANHALPIIMTDVGCAGELIINEESGLVVPVGNSDALLSAMKRIITDADFGMRIGMNAKRAVVSLPTKEQTLERYKDGWQKTITRAKSEGNGAKNIFTI